MTSVREFLTVHSMSEEPNAPKTSRSSKTSGKRKKEEEGGPKDGWRGVFLLVKKKDRVGSGRTIADNLWQVTPTLH